MVIYPEQSRIDKLRAEDPCGTSSNNQLFCQATIEALKDAIAKAEASDELRDILETIAELL